MARFGSTASERDVYANLLRDTRGLRREQGTARDGWFAALPWERKEETLFELEMLLKGIACFGNVRNYPGPPRKTPAVAHDFHEELRILRATVDRSVELVRELLGPKDRAYTFSRYLETVLPEDAARSKLVREQLSQDTPEEALFVLRNAFSGGTEILDGVLRVGRVTHRLWFALHGALAREIGRNVYFNPLVALEFRPEFDRIRNAEVLEALDRVESDTAHRVVALTFLALFRALRYVALVDQYAADTETMRLAFVILSVLRSDLRALTRFLSRRAAPVIADGFERELLAVRATDVRLRAKDLGRVASSLVSMRGTLESVAATLRIEVRKTFERDLPAPDVSPGPAELGPQLVIASAELRATIEHAIGTLALELRPAEGPVLVGNSRRAASERLRRDVWMFAQVLRAFLAKAQAVQGGALASVADADLWGAQASFQFVREFLGHFRAIGYQLVRSSDYERLDPFLAALETLRDVDLIDPARMRAVLAECDEFYAYLLRLFEQVGQRQELAERPFDRKGAAEMLKIYLGAA